MIMMQNNSGWVLLDRKILDWEWIDDPETCALFIYCILRANWKDGKYHGTVVKRGQFITSLPKLAKETGLTIRQARTALSHLVSTGEVTDEASSRGRVITVNNYCRYQDATDKTQTNDTPSTDEATRDRTLYNNNNNINKGTINTKEPEPEEKPDGRVKVRYNDPEFAKQYPYADGWRADAEGYMYKLSAKEAKKARDERQRALSIQRR